MNIAEIKAKIAKLRKGLDNAAVPASAKPGIQVQIEKLEGEVAEAEKEEADKAEAERLKAEKKKEKTKKPAKAPKAPRKPIEKKAPVVKPPEPPKPKDPESAPAPVGKKRDVKISDCSPERQKVISGLKDVIDKYLKSHESNNAAPRRKAKTATKTVSKSLSTGIAAKIRGAVAHEMTNEKAPKIKTNKLKEATGFFQKGLESLKEALGGIPGSASFADFEKEMDKLVDLVTAKQEEIKKKVS